MLANPQTRRRNLISLTPLIDVVFILLVFFMLASNFLEWRSINLEPPAKSTGAARGMEGTLLIEIREDGLRLSGRPVTETELAELVADHLQESPDRSILVKPAPPVTLQETVKVLDILTAAGASNTSLIRTKRD